MTDPHGFIDDIRRSVFEPLRYFVDPTERLFVLYLVSGLVCALFVFLLAVRRNPAGAPRGFLRYLFPKGIYLHPSAKADYRFFLIDRVLSFLFLPYFVILVPAVAKPVFALLTWAFGAPQSAIMAPGFATNLVITIVSALAIDFALWWIHLLHHRIPILWEFHKVHHSAEVMTPITAYRMHPVEIILNYNLTGIVSGIVFGLFRYLTADSYAVLSVLGVDIITFAFLVFGFTLRHSHVPMAYPAALSHLLVSPWMHQVHHSCEKRHLDKNMGFIFAFWDWMFGTLYVPKPGETFAIGLDSGEAPRFHSAIAMYVRPFRNIAARLGRPVPSAGPSKHS